MTLIFEIATPAPAPAAPQGPFHHLVQLLGDPIVVANLGSSNDVGPDLHPVLRKQMTAIEIDAVAGSHVAASHYGRLIRIHTAVAGSTAPRTFRVNRYAGCSGFLPPKMDVVRSYGLESFVEIQQTHEVVPTTLPIVLQENGLARLDFLKTDLEGLDLEVIRSCEAYLDRTLVVQAELRFQPYFEGEPYFHEAAGYLASQDFELIGLKTEYWKHTTPNRNAQRKGRAVWADCVFFKSPGMVAAMPDPAPAMARQVVLASMLGHENYAEYLLNLYRSHVPADAFSDLTLFLGQRATGKRECPHPDFPHCASE